MGNTEHSSESRSSQGEGNLRGNRRTRFGQSALFVVPVNGAVTLPPLTFGSSSPIPDVLEVALPSQVPVQVGSAVRLAVKATYPGGKTADVTSANSGTNYSSADSTVATVGPDGLVTAISNGTVFISAFNEGTSGFAVVNVGSPPGVSITSPANGSTAVEGSTLLVTLNVRGGPIVGVTLLANGSPVGILVTAPFVFHYPVPATLKSVTLTATAMDAGGQTADSKPVTITTTADPLRPRPGS